MSKLSAVRDAKALMTEAMDWSVFKWLWEKSNVRQTADEANAALDRLDKKTKAQWGEELKLAYRHLVAGNGKSNGRPSSETDLQILPLLRTVKDLDEKAKAARTEAEATFDDAEKNMNVSLAREGCKKAIRSWDLHEKAIRAAEALVSSFEKSHSA